VQEECLIQMSVCLILFHPLSALLPSLTSGLLTDYRMAEQMLGKLLFMITELSLMKCIAVSASLLFCCWGISCQSFLSWRVGGRAPYVLCEMGIIVVQFVGHWKRRCLDSKCVSVYFIAKYFPQKRILWPFSISFFRFIIIYLFF